MKANELNDWLGVITNLGVIAGLVLVAYEVHQNSLGMEREGRVAMNETTFGLRDAWQNFSFAIIENEDVASLWVRGRAGEPLTPVEKLRFEGMASEFSRLWGQNYSQSTTLAGAPADWAIYQFAETTTQHGPGLRCAVLDLLDRGIQNTMFVARIKEVDPPELRRNPTQPCPQA